MARTPKMAHIKAQLVERARQEEEIAAITGTLNSRVTQFGPHATTGGATSTGDDIDEEESDEEEVVAGTSSIYN
ncbi:hypothetical protein PHYSODRAFT_330524 [Phytophthora sojae]|uniref:Uncharacterized protein n=1 Tax=Phytophthora sojae (strain P6497) TaxID=1094619 RepID=G4ZD39_PHYSP|nr:hypothetical protein PHYSODRAFT_330524 [Phytophthora sojae]EGZ16447.1 hypothetical protein PHYSODRAFT_330524 [Phytophthora sojae]|eukprot:XP_009525505.1 hypothetical protein PHYSODRAFT_330524 [Phytophthora sojae]